MREFGVKINKKVYVLKIEFDYRKPTNLFLRKFREKYISLNEVKAAFKKFDKNRDGSLSKSEVSRLMHRLYSNFIFTQLRKIIFLMNLRKQI